MFNSFKKARSNTKKSKEILKSLEAKNINVKCFRLFLNAKDISMYDVTDDLINEFLNRENPIEKIAIPCSLTLPEMYSNVNNFAGAAVGAVTGKEHNFTNTTREQVKVNTNAIIAPKGIVFKGALNKTEDLRIPWEDISDCKTITSNRLGIFTDIKVGSIKYPLFFSKNKLGQLFVDYVKQHMAGNIDDGWI